MADTEANVDEDQEEEEEGTKEKPWPPEEWGKEVTYVIKEFPHLFKNKLDPESRIKAPPMDTKWKEDAVLPQCTHTRQIPVHLKGMADAFVEEALKRTISRYSSMEKIVKRASNCYIVGEAKLSK